MNKKIILAALVFGGLLNSTAFCSKAGQFSAGVGVSTLGFGGNVGYKINNYFKVRAVVNYFQLTKKFGDSEVDYKGTLRMFSIGALADWHFLQNGFRVTGGLLYNGNNVKIKATPSGSHSYNGVTYTPQQIGEVKGTVSFRPISPYLGIGFDSGHESCSGFIFNADIGVLFQGSARGKINSISGQLSNNSAALDNVKEDVMKQINKKSWIKTYPVISLGVSYKF